MPKVKTSYPIETREKGERNLVLPPVINRILPQWQHPDWMAAQLWRRAVNQQPFAQICKTTLTDMVTALDWKIDPVDTSQRDELKPQIDYYTDLFENGNGTYDYMGFTEFIMGDYLDLPFGAGVELGWQHDDPSSGKLLWFEPLDAGTLFPTRASDFPVGQAIQLEPIKTIYFPYYAINRLWMNPRSVWYRQGWGVAPPEKIYLALVLLDRGDQYYANMLLDTPEVGLLDLGDMAEDSAQNWLKSWQTLLQGVDPFKIPVLYEHNTPAKFISFTHSPQDLTFDRTTLRYAAMCAAAYGMSLSDIGLQATSSGGETLAGSIRQERRTRRTGLSQAKSKLRLFWNRMLPDYLKFNFIDTDEEQSVAVGRARLANATAFDTWIKAGVFSAEEARLQAISDGLITISIPEQMPEDMQPPPQPQQPANERPSLLGRPIAPSDGGHGEVLPRSEALQFLADFGFTEDQIATIPELANDLSLLPDIWDGLPEDERKEVLEELQNYLNNDKIDAERINGDA
jgi:hypothetical protein